MRFPLVFVAGLAAAQVVPYERILNSAKEPHNWLTYSGNYSGQRYSTLDQINPSNIKRLKVAWVHQSGSTEAHQTSPIVVDGVMFITEGPNVVKSLDARSGTVFWRYEHKIPNDLRLCCGRPNRGVAILNNTVYYGSIDADLVALDARTGRVKWTVKMADYKQGYSSTVAPLLFRSRCLSSCLRRSRNTSAMSLYPCSTHRSPSRQCSPVDI